MIGLGVSLTTLAGTGQAGDGADYDSAAVTLFAAMTTPPTEARKDAINSLIGSLKNAGLWSKLDVLQVFAAADSQAAVLNWKNPATFTAAGVNTPTFTADRGYAGNGTTSYVDTTWAPTNGVNYTQDDATVFAWSRTSGTNSNRWMGSATDTSVLLLPRTAGSAFQYRINTTGSVTAIGSVTDGSGLFAVSRSGATATQSYRNGATLGAAGSIASTALSSSPINVGRQNTQFNPAECAVWGAGSNFSAAEHLALYNAIRTYLVDAGAAS